MQRTSSSKRRFFWFASGGCLVLLFVASVVCWMQVSDWISPSRTLDAFCRALVAQDYATAYSHLGQDYQQGLPYATFAAEYRSNNGDGRVIACQEQVHDDGIFGMMGILDLRYANGTTGKQAFRLDQEFLFFWKLLPDSP